VPKVLRDLSCSKSCSAWMTPPPRVPDPVGVARIEQDALESSGWEARASQVAAVEDSLRVARTLESWELEREVDAQVAADDAARHQLGVIERQIQYQRAEGSGSPFVRRALVGPWSPVSPAGGSVAGVGRVSLSQEEKSSESLPVERRVRPRAASIALSPTERRSAHDLLERAAVCGSQCAVLSRQTVTGGSREVMVMRMGCHARSCDRCMVRIREGHRSRVIGPWQQLLTLGVPSGEVTARVAWGEIHRSIGKFVHYLRDSLRDGSNDVRVAGGGKLEYAWVIEAHESGYPHVHMAHNLEWLDRGAAIRAWARATGLGVRGIHQERVRDKSGTSRYLVKYMTKARLTLDVLVLLAGKHLIGSTIRRKKEDRELWDLLRIEKFRSAESMLMGSDEWMRKVGCVVKSRVESMWSIWSIPEVRESDLGVEGVGLERARVLSRVLLRAAPRGRVMVSGSGIPLRWAVGGAPVDAPKN
jgi:hypothetical protein